MNTNRRTFLKTLIGGGVALSLPLPLLAKASGQSLTILHTNDVHSHLEPFPVNHPKFPNQGGFARRATLIQQLRQKHSNVLLLDAGDIFQGTPYFNFFGGKPELELMSKMKYDAATIGNHEFDNGMDHLARQLQYANFPFISTNYDFSQTVLKDKIIPWKIIEKGPFRVGLIGLGVNPGGLVSPANYEGMKWLDPVETGEKTARFLKEEKKCNLVIALSHMGYTSAPDRPESDKKTAALTASIDIIIGGHSHTFMPKPEIVKNKVGKPVIINQVGWAGVILGHMEIIPDKKEPLFLATQHLIK
ncbi:bifunctional metallophosphatase/5'-nucleotidase [Thermophagus xiamenensis]|uniref:5'-nucleotidase n=1 Tax=Thermophagus xiamenensis TaxID=385682 RepID=A0A1I2F459_9BACT|nr:metallophosphoesterase [Thermophagus xiamenensis]SFE99311.1 5'-nucleotidase [Thermophagus xiamenensis]